MTTLPLVLEPGTRIALIGNLLRDAERRFGHLETLLHQQGETQTLRFTAPSDPARATKGTAQVASF